MILFCVRPDIIYRGCKTFMKKNKFVQDIDLNLLPKLDMLNEYFKKIQLLILYDTIKNQNQQDINSRQGSYVA